MKTTCLLPCFILMLLGCNQLSDYRASGKAYSSGTAGGAISCSPESGVLDLKGSQTGHLKRPAVQREFRIILEGFKILPVPGLGSLATFTSTPDSAMVMGDIIAGEKDLALIEREVASSRLSITDIHRYPARDRSVILFMHIKGFGNDSMLSENVNALVSKLTGIGEYTDKNRKIKTVTTTLNTAKLDSIIGYPGSHVGAIYQHNVERVNVLNARGMHGKNSTNFNTWAAWQGTDEEAIVAGDFTMLAKEVEPVIKAMAESGFELVHNQVVHENPKLFCLHYWAVGNAEKLAKGLRAAFDHQE